MMLRQVVSRLTRSEQKARKRIELLRHENRERRDPELDRRLVRLRTEAFASLERRPPEEEPPEARSSISDGFASYSVVDGVPEIDAAGLRAETIRHAFLGHGCLLVRGLMDPGRAAELREGIDRAFEQRDAFAEGAPVERTTPWFEPFEPGRRFNADTEAWNRIKAGSGAAWACDSPRMMFELFEAFEDSGIPEIAGDYLGERPAFSMNKALLRRTPPDATGAWHQDGAFLGEGIRTLNVWLALSECGEDAPGLEIVGRRFDSIVDTGTEGAQLAWSVSDQLAGELLDGASSLRPVFAPGDAMLFDHLCLHRTGSDPSMTKVRYATETWCFAPSTFPSKLVPIVV